MYYNFLRQLVGNTHYAEKLLESLVKSLQQEWVVEKADLDNLREAELRVTLHWILTLQQFIDWINDD